MSKTTGNKSELKPHGMGGDLGIEPYLPQFHRALPMRSSMRRDLLGESVTPRTYEERIEGNKPLKQQPFTFMA